MFFVHDKLTDTLINVDAIEAFQACSEPPFGRVWFAWGNDPLDVHSSEAVAEIRTRLRASHVFPTDKKYKTFSVFPWQGKEVLIDLHEIKAIVLTDNFVLFYRRYSTAGYEEILAEGSGICCDKSIWDFLSQETHRFSISPLL